MSQSSMLIISMCYQVTYPTIVGGKRTKPSFTMGLTSLDEKVLLLGLQTLTLTLLSI